MHLRVAAADVVSHAGKPSENLATVDALTSVAARAGARLLIMPQSFLTGLATSEAEAKERALLSDAPELLRLAAIARSREIAIVCGYVEFCTGRYHDSALILDHRGCALANYRRTHLDGTAAVLARGQWLTVVPLAEARLGLLIGADIEAPEQAQALTLAGANLLVVLGGEANEARIVGDALLPARAFESRCSLAYANGNSDPATARARILGPRGDILAITEHHLAIADAPLTVPDAGVRRMAERRPHLYRRLSEIPPDQVGLRD